MTPRKWNLPLTYQPKIRPVIDGTCRQTIRIVNKGKHGEVRKNVGDLVRFYIWEGKPYRSKRKTITEYVPITEAVEIHIWNFGVSTANARFGWPELDNLAMYDGIIPPTGTALHDVLMEKNGRIPEEGVKAQVLRW